MPDPTFPILETERLKLGETDHSLVDEVLGLYSDPRVCKYLPFPCFTTRAEAEVILEQWHSLKTHGTGYRWGIWLIETGQFIGAVGVKHWDKRVNAAELTFALKPEFWGSGYMREAIFEVLHYAFKVMQLRRLAAYADPEDIRTQNLLMGLGFKIEGIMRGHDVINGEYVDDMIFAMLSNEYSTTVY